MSTATTAAQQRDQAKSYKDEHAAASDSDLDFEDDRVVGSARNSTEIANHDREVLESEEEREKLLTEGSRDKGPKSFFNKGRQNGRRSVEDKEARREARRSRRRRKKGKEAHNDEEGELMYEMEEGGAGDEGSSQTSSSSVELDKLNIIAPTTSKRRRTRQCAFIATSIVTLFCLLTFGAYEVSHTSHIRPNVTLLSNGSSMFAPTTILISLDGFRADFLTRGITPTLNRFVAEGVSPKHMLPSFPSVTFPNHFTLVTGLYPESHGVVGNTFWDPELKEEFYYTDPTRSMQPKWWAGGEPIWVTAEKAKVKTAVHMWPGSEAGMQFEATYLDKFNGSEVLSRKTERILQLLDLPSIEKDSASSQRPQLIAAYVPVVDAEGHSDGPNSTAVWDAISDVDTMLHDIFVGIDERNLTDIVNVVVVSDHGMATTSIDRLIQLDDLIDLDLIEHIDGWPLYGLRPKDPIDLRGLYDRLSVEAEKNTNFEVYLRDENMPERYHFTKNDRIAPLWVVPKTGWAIVHKEDFDIREAKAKGKDYSPKGLHGYDHEHPLMRAIFIARGPAFPHQGNSRLATFQNIEVYNIVCDSLGIVPKPNNGTMRLPLKPIGLHSDKPDAIKDAPNDPSSEGNPQETTPGITSKTVEAVAKTENESEEKMDDFWAYMKAKMAAAMKWADNAMSHLKSSGKSSGKSSEEPE